jgi:5-methylcytosine-specific restriction endonuclease McrA
MMLRARVDAIERKLLRLRKSFDEARKAEEDARRAEEDAQREAFRRAIDPKVVVWGVFTPLRFCRHCGILRRGLTPTDQPQRLEERGRATCDPCAKKRYKESQREYRKEYQKKSRKLGKRDNGKHRKRTRRHGGAYEVSITAAAVAKRDGFICQLCGHKVHKHRGGADHLGWTVGHIHPLSAGGDHSWDNVQCECWSCNTLKGAREMTREQFRLQHPEICKTDTEGHIIQTNKNDQAA